MTNSDESLQMIHTIISRNIFTDIKLDQLMTALKHNITTLLAPVIVPAEAASDPIKTLVAPVVKAEPAL
jgi:hypothetical protein